MALLSLVRINELFGEAMPIADVSGTVDGSSHYDLQIGEQVVLTNVTVEKSGNFICRKKLNESNRVVQTVGWLTPSGRFLALGSLYKKNAEGLMNPKNENVPMTTINRADILPALIGKTVTIVAKEEIDVAVFQPKPGDPTTRKGSWYTFKVA